MLFRVETNDGTFYTDTNKKDLTVQMHRYVSAKRDELVPLADIRFVFSPCPVIHHNGLRNMDFHGGNLRTAIVNAFPQG